MSNLELVTEDDDLDIFVVDSHQHGRAVGTEIDRSDKRARSAGHLLLDARKQTLGDPARNAWTESAAQKTRRSCYSHPSVGRARKRRDTCAVQGRGSALRGPRPGHFAAASPPESLHLRRGRRTTRGCIGSSLLLATRYWPFMTRNTTCKVDAHDAVPALHGERISNPFGLSAGMRKCPAPLRREVPSRANAVARAAEKPAARGQRRVAARAQPRALHQSER